MDPPHTLRATLSMMFRYVSNICVFPNESDVSNMQNMFPNANDVSNVCFQIKGSAPGFHFYFTRGNLV